MKTRFLLIIAIVMVVGTAIALGANLMSENAKQREIKLNQSHLAYDPVADPLCFVADRATSGETGSGVTMDACFTLKQFEEMGCTKPMLEHILRYSNLLDEEVDGPVYLEWAGLPNGITQEKFDKCFDTILEKRPILDSKFETDIKNCNGIDGKEELECFADSFESCTLAKINYVIYTIEGDPGYLKAAVQENDECSIHITFDNTQDRFSHPDDRIITEDRCSGIEFTKHMMNIGNCDSFYDYQLNYESPDWPSHEKCQSIGGEWNYQFHNCVNFDGPVEPSCESLDGTISCMPDEQKGHGRDMCIPVCEFEVIDTK